MLFSRKKHGFVSKRNIFIRIFRPLFRWMPLVAVFSLGIFGSHVYHKNNQLVLANASNKQFSEKVDIVSNELSQKNQINDKLSAENLELQEKLNLALEKIKDNEIKLKLSDKTIKPKNVKNQESVFKDQNKKLKEQLKNQLALIKKSKEDNSALQQENSEKIKTLTEKLSDGKKFAKNLRNENKDLKLQLQASLSNLNSYKSNSLVETETSKSRNVQKLIVNSSTEKDSELKTVSLPSSEALNVEKIDKKQISSRNTAKNKTLLKAQEFNIMKLKKGESLWNLSKRAYGKGIYYKKILNENPNITERNFKKLQPGANIRVPKIK